MEKASRCSGVSPAPQHRDRVKAEEGDKACEMPKNHQCWNTLNTSRVSRGSGVL